MLNDPLSSRHLPKLLSYYEGFVSLDLSPRGGSLAAAFQQAL